MTSSATIQRYREAPNAVKWLIWAVAFVSVFLIWEGSVMNVARAWNEEADAIERKVSAVRASPQTAQRLARMDDTVVNLGRVTRPRRESDGRAGLTTAVIDVVQNRLGAKGYSFDLSGGGDKLREDLSAGIVRAGYRVSRLTGTLKFESAPDDAIAIIAALEDREEIEAIRQVSILKGDGRVVEVSLVLEAWVEVAPTKRGR